MLDRQVLLHSIKAEIAQLVARRSHNPKVVSAILTFRTVFRYDLSQDIDDVLQTCETMRSCACCGTAHAIMRAADGVANRLRTCQRGPGWRAQGMLVAPLHCRRLDQCSVRTVRRPGSRGACVNLQSVLNKHWLYGATAARLTPDQKVGSSNLSVVIFP